MTAQIIDGRAIGNRIQDTLKTDVETFQTEYGYPPGLGAILAGDNPASQMYVRMKQRACKRIGIHSIAHTIPADVTQTQVEALVDELNADEHIHGILVQLPLPPQIDEEAVLSRVALEKDVDGFHPVNIGRLAQKGRDPEFTPATPTGCMVLLDEIGAELSGANAVVIGRSNIVGMPMALMLIKANATVTVCHSRTQNLPEIVRQADIVIAAIGRASYVQADWLKPGAVVIDVGTNRIDDPEARRGYRWEGDVDFEAAKEISSAITQVPGGVGPMTITMLLSNTLKAAQQLATSQT